jgi:hypothetical protein
LFWLATVDERNIERGTFASAQEREGGLHTP